MRINLSLLLLSVVVSAPALAVTISIDPGVTLPGNGIGSSQSGSLLVDSFDTGRVAGVNTPGFVASNTSVRNFHNAPAGDSSRYAFLDGVRALGQIAFRVPTGQRIDYIGFYLGSIDPYNYFTFLDNKGNKLNVDFKTTSLGTEINGTQIVTTVAGRPAADLTNHDTKANLFVDFAFAANEQVSKILVR